MADDYIQAAGHNAFLTVMGGRRSDFVWGCNANAANQGILLIQVYFITRNQKYLDAALGNLEYILGRNATGYCFVTGCGIFHPCIPITGPLSPMIMWIPYRGFLPADQIPVNRIIVTMIFTNRKPPMWIPTVPMLPMKSPSTGMHRWFTLPMHWKPWKIILPIINKKYAKYKNCHRTI